MEYDALDTWWKYKKHSQLRSSMPLPMWCLFWEGRPIFLSATTCCVRHSEPCLSPQMCLNYIMSPNNPISSSTKWGILVSSRLAIGLGAPRIYSWIPIKYPFWGSPFSGSFLGFYWNTRVKAHPGSRCHPDWVHILPRGGMDFPIHVGGIRFPDTLPYDDLFGVISSPLC